MLQVLLCSVLSYHSNTEAALHVFRQAGPPQRIAAWHQGGKQH